jgi:hypothetical protein
MQRIQAVKDLSNTHNRDAHIVAAGAFIIPSTIALYSAYQTIYNPNILYKLLGLITTVGFSAFTGKVVLVGNDLINRQISWNKTDQNLPIFKKHIA